MQFVVFTKAGSNKKIAIPVDSIVYFEESTIDVRATDGIIKTQDCVKIEAQKIGSSGLEWVKPINVTERFETVYDRIEKAKKDKLDSL